MKPLSVEESDIGRIAEKTVLSYGPNSATKATSFWILLALAGIIATAGVAADSTATVIGAMIVAPLMTPILGTAYSLVIGKRKHLVNSLLTVFGGALLVISIAFLFGMLDPVGALTESNLQVEARIHPRLIDLIAAMATGMVGAFALVRSDISDTLPGVAIAISLVPPLAVAGLTLHDGKTQEALGALLLFGTNVASIIFTATLILLLYNVRETAKNAGFAVGSFRGWSLAAVLGSVVLVAIPLFIGTQKIINDTHTSFYLAPLAEEWAQENDWRVVSLVVREKTIKMVAFGPPPEITVDELREAIDEAGYAEHDLEVNLVVGRSKLSPGK